VKYFPEKLSVRWISTIYAAGDITPLELMGEIVRRAKATMHKNIWIIPPSLEFIEPFVRKIEKLPLDERGPLWGVPFAVKDNIDVANLATTAACPAYAYVPKAHAETVRRLVDVGAVPVGKTNMDQFATGLVGMRSPYGETHNAYQPELISGGSSSGSAVSVALGMAAFALGTDTAGSGRVPAALNTLVGYKPPIGSWSNDGVVPACRSLDCVTVFANNIGDTALVDKVVRNTAGDSPRVLPKRILIPKEPPRFFGKWGDVYRRKWLEAVLRIERLGVEILRVDTEVFSSAAKLLYDGAFVAERWADLGGFVDAHPGEVFSVTETILRTGAKKNAADLFKDIHAIGRMREQVKSLLQDDIIVMPTVGGTFTREEARGDPIATNSLMGLYTNHCNLLNLCAIALPENERDRDCPFGITFFSLAEDRLFAVAEKFMESCSCVLAVCGLHKKGFPLESQLTELGARFLRHAKTAVKYRLFLLQGTPKRPGLIRYDDGAAIEVDLFELSLAKLGLFMEKVPSPLAIGSIELSDGTMVKGFLCEACAVSGAEDITALGGFTHELLGGVYPFR